MSRARDDVLWKHTSTSALDAVRLLAPEVVGQALARIVSRVRAEKPRSRGGHFIVLSRNSSCTKQERCNVCGEVGPTWAAKWRKTKMAETWRELHEARHLSEELFGGAP